VERENTIVKVQFRGAAPPSTGGGVGLIAARDGSRRARPQSGKRADRRTQATAASITRRRADEVFRDGRRATTTSSRPEASNPGSARSHHPSKTSSSTVSTGSVPSGHRMLCSGILSEQSTIIPDTMMSRTLSSSYVTGLMFSLGMMRRGVCMRSLTGDNGIGSY